MADRDRKTSIDQFSTRQFRNPFPHPVSNPRFSEIETRFRGKRASKRKSIWVFTQSDPTLFLKKW